MKDIIRIEKLHKSFGEIKAVNDLTFSVKEGEFFAFLGVNGAGKSTTISMLCGQLEKDDGKIYIDGTEVDGKNDEIKRELGVVFQNSVMDKPLTVYDNLKSRAAAYGIKGKEFEKNLSEIDEKLHLQEIIKRPVGKLSGGQRRRADVARALIHNPKILILDEPTTGLDPQTRRMLWEVISELRVKRKITVLLTTHYMEEAADADYVVIMDNGKISAEGTPIELKNKYSGDFINLYNVDEEKVKILGKKYEKTSVGYKVEVEDTKTATELILKYPEIFSDYEIRKGKMDDVFLAVTGKKFIEGEKR